MAASNYFFEQIPIETVKRIAKVFSAEKVVGGDGEEKEVPAEVTSSCEPWRELAEKVQDERDPEKMLCLIEQLIDALDGKRSRSVLPRRQDAASRED